MGIYRSTPLMDKNTETGANEYLEYVACGMQGILILYFLISGQAGE